MSQTEDCEDGAYEVLPRTIEEFEMKVNPTYGVVSKKKKTAEDFQQGTACYNIKMITVLVIVMTFTVAAACIAFALEISNLKTETASTQDFARLENSTLKAIDMVWENLNANLTELNSELKIIKSVLQTLRNLHQGQSETYPASSCAALPPSSPSGYYWVTASNGSAVRVYCDMTRSCGNITGGWMRVAALDMTNSSHQCPSGLMERTNSTIRTCVSSSFSAGCSPDIILETHGINYTRVCGKVIGYQIGHTNAFNRDMNEDISGDYVDGVSITHGNPRQHIWTFAAARDDLTSGSLNSKCLCITNGESRPPQFVGEDYFCDTAGTSQFIANGQLFSNQPLWDSDGCGATNNCCLFNTPPWFHKQLPQLTTDNIQMRVCRNEGNGVEDIAIETINFYVS